MRVGLTGGIAYGKSTVSSILRELGEFRRETDERLRKLEGEHGADFTNFIPRAGNIGLTYNLLPVNIKLNYNYRGPQKLSTQSAINGFQYYAERKYFDLNAEYSFSKRATLFINGRNITNYPQDRVNLGNNIDYSRMNQVEEFGVQWAVGIKGQF